MPEPVVSVVVPTFRRAAMLGKCLDSIQSTAKLPHEVICVHVAGDAESAEVLRRRPEPLRLIEQPTRGGLVQAMNMGFHTAKGRYIIQINDDCELMPHSLANAVRFLEAPAHANVGQAAFFHDSPVKRNVQAQICVEGVWYFVCHVRGLCFANFGMARRELSEKLGYFDERYFMYGADPDFSLKVWQAGLTVEPCPGALIRHHELNDERGAAERAAQHSDNRKLFDKWGMGE
jgi:GT2 family glycosyltransferase